MKESKSRQRCYLADTPAATPDLKIKYVPMMVFEEAGKTIIQPVTANSETPEIRELFRSGTLEVWLSNGQRDPAQFDVAILKYKQQVQPPTMCSRAQGRMCLKNHLETIVSCAQCPLNDEGAED
ncbi:MAG: hypothetical protein ACE14S_07885 [Candidatus Bathyarchaeia archaeon]